MGTFISQIRHCAQVLVPATVYSCLAAVFDNFELGSLQLIELAKKGLCSLLALWDIILPLPRLKPNQAVKEQHCV